MSKAANMIETEKRRNRKSELKLVERNHSLRDPKSGERFELATTIATSEQRAESLQIVQEMMHSFMNTVEFYKTEQGGEKSHKEAVEKALSLNEWYREQAQHFHPEKIDWHHIAAVAEKGMDEALQLWARVRESADDELASGRRAAKVVGDNAEARAMAQFLAIRDWFADQWQPSGGIEWALIDMLTISHSLYMYWQTTAHQRAVRTHNRQTEEVERFESQGWKAPFQSEAAAIDQAHRLADGYNRQFLRVLRQLRDLRRYTPVVIQNNGGQVNVGSQQQINVQQPK